MDKVVKITKAQNDKVARENALKLLQEGKFDEFLQVGNNSYAVNVRNAEDKPTVARLDIVIPKVEENRLAEDLEGEYLDEKEIKEQEAKAVAEAKAKAKAKKTK